MPVPPPARSGLPATEAGTSIELFTGAGGLAVAMHNAGFRHLLAVENDARACQTLRSQEAVPYDRSASHPSKLGDSWPLYEGDVHLADFRPFDGQVDVVAGGVPCQPWSLGGAHKGYEDKRNLWPELFRCVREAKPLAVLAENVKGLLRPSFKPYYDYILHELSAPFEERVKGEDWRDHDRRLVKLLDESDYDPATRYDVGYWLVNAADYGVPQLRWRVFVIAFRKDMGLEGWQIPRPTHSKIALLHDQADGGYWKRHEIERRRMEIEDIPSPDGLKPWRTVRDALYDNPDWPDQRPLPPPLEPLKGKLEHPNFLHHYGWPGAREYPGHSPNDLDMPAKTVKAGVHGVPGGETVLRLDDGSLRYMTVREVARVMTFPDDRRLDGPRGEQVRQLGNAVPVQLGEVMASAVAKALRSVASSDSQESTTDGCPRTDRPTNDITEDLGDVRQDSSESGSWASSPAVRAVMRGNKGRDTKPEVALRSAVHALGMRYRVGARPLPQVRRTADIVFTRAKVAVFLDGCFWHGCPEHHRPAKRNTDFWDTKIKGNIDRDANTDSLLHEAGWRVIRVWEHEDPADAAKRVAEVVRAQTTS